ncbi:MAG: heme biosynthesis HemY N-terminal domain-containing protein [Burkholderiaceae bacterium]
MRLLIKLLVVLGLAVGLGLLIQYHEGSVTISLPPDEFHLAPNELALAILAMFVLGYLVVRIGFRLFTLPEWIGGIRGRRRQRKAESALHDTVLALHEGDYERVNRLAQRAQGHEGTAGPAALLAARAAHLAGNIAQRNDWLQVSANDRNTDKARIVLAAETALDDDRPADAMAILAQATPEHAGSVAVLRMRLRAEQALDQWKEALATATRLHQRQVYGDEALRALRVRAYEALFAAATQVSEVDALYKQLGREEKAIDEIVESAAEAYAAGGDEATAARLVEQTMERRLSSRLLVLFTRLDTIPPRDRLRIAERWQSQYQDDARILATLGRLCLLEGLWGKAEALLRQANEKSPSPFTRLALADMYEALGRQQDASELYRAIARDHRPALPAGNG